MYLVFFSSGSPILVKMRLTNSTTHTIHILTVTIRNPHIENIFTKDIQVCGKILHFTHTYIETKVIIQKSNIYYEPILETYTLRIREYKPLILGTFSTFDIHLAQTIPMEYIHMWSN